MLFFLRGLRHILAGLIFALSAASPSLAALPEHTAQLITADPAISRTIIWQTKEHGRQNWVEYKRQNSRFILKRIPAVTAAIPNFDHSEQKFRHSAYISGLTPGENYVYRTVSDEHASAWYSLKTPSANSFKALLFGDSQSVNYAAWGATAQTAWQRNPDTDFFINMGDLIDNGQHAWQWNEWLKNAAPLLRAIPVAPISGNHENYSLAWQFTSADIYNTLFTLPQNGASKFTSQTYSFNCGNVHFVVLDSQLKEQSAWQPDLFEIQQKWLEQDLAAADKRWKIILIHRNLLTYDGNDKPTEAGYAFMPIFEKYQVDIVFSGHIHAYGRTIPLKNMTPDSSGVIYISTGRSGDDVWPVPQKKHFELVFDAQLAQTNYLTLTADDSALTIRNYQFDGTLHDELVLNKK